MLSRFLNGQSLRLSTADRLARYLGFDLVRIGDPLQNRPRKSVRPVTKESGRQGTLLRLMKLLSLLQFGGSLSSLSEALGVSERTIYRDISTLKSAGILVSFDKDRTSYHAVLPKVSVASETKRVTRSTLVESILDEASGMADDGLLVGALISAVAMLEFHLLRLCEDSGLGVKPKMSAATYNSLLSNKKKYPDAVSQKIRAIVEMRNKAAHGNPTGLTKATVKDFVNFVKWLQQNYPLTQVHE